MQIVCYWRGEPIRILQVTGETDTTYITDEKFTDTDEYVTFLKNDEPFKNDHEILKRVYRSDIDDTQYFRSYYLATDAYEIDY